MALGLPRSTNAVISRNIYGHLVEYLGVGVYNRIWVGDRIQFDFDAA